MEVSALPASPHVLVIKVRNCAQSHRVFLLHHFIQQGGGIHWAAKGLTELLSLVPCPCLHLLWAEPLGHIGGWMDRKGFSVSNASDSDVSTICLSVCLVS